MYWVRRGAFELAVTVATDGEPQFGTKALSYQDSNLPFKYKRPQNCCGVLREFGELRAEFGAKKLLPDVIFVKIFKGSSDIRFVFEYVID